MKVLVIAAHPDDEVIGAGGTMVMHAERGDEVFLCIVTQAYSPPWPENIVDQVREQVKQVQQILGIRRVFTCGFPTVQLNTVPHMELSTAIQSIVDEVLPEIVYTTPEYDINTDHCLVFNATVVATRPLPGSSVRRLLSYEITTTSRYGTRQQNPNVYVDVTKYVTRKMQAMACYKTELRDHPHPRSLESMKILMQERGICIGAEAAESFVLVREIL